MRFMVIDHAQDFVTVGSPSYIEIGRDGPVSQSWRDDGLVFGYR